MQQVSRLIRNFTPTEYHLSLNLERIERSFSGVVTIKGEAHQVGKLRLHSKDLLIESITIDGHEASWQSDENDELLITAEAISKDSHALVIVFSGKITDGMHGLYPCYFSHDGKAKELLATQFESHHAREVFPCVDEPEAKATFDVTLTTEQHVKVLGNMPIKSQVVESEQLVTIFERTPRMSSYLLAWVVGELHKKTARTKGGVEVNVWATPAQASDQLDFALDIATRTIDFYDEYFGVKYPLPKSDHVALPDFSSGAMENWGLITYREVALLSDPKTAGVNSKHFVASVIAHELAHQWFGNLVTMKWWNNLWLNESFADFVEHIALDALHPEWETWLDFILSRGIAALRRDAIDGVQSVQVDVNHPDEISSLFDGAIVYGKGARLMKMLRSYIGDNAFRAGLKHYFETYAYKNTEGEDLWNCLETVSGKPVADFMNAWITRSGYPVLQVEPGKLSQSRFFIGEHQPSEQIWPVLLNPEPAKDLPELLDTRELVIDTSADQHFNSGDTSHYVTRYENNHLLHLLKHIDSFSTIDRLTLLNDQSLLTRGNYQSSTSLIDVLAHYKNETNDAVWSIMSLTLSELKKFVETDLESETALRKLSGSIAKAQYERLGFDEKAGESINDAKLRPTIISMMLYAEDQAVIDAALTQFKPDSLLELSDELRPLIISTAIRHSNDESVVSTLMDIYEDTSSAELREDITSGVTSTKSPEVAKKLFTAILSKTIRPQDVTPWYVYLLRNRHTRDIAWDWIRDNWPWIIETFKGDKSYDDFPKYSAGGLINREQLSEYKAFFLPMQHEPALSRAISMGISEIEAKLQLIERDGEAVRGALRNLNI